MDRMSTTIDLAFGAPRGWARIVSPALVSAALVGCRTTSVPDNATNAPASAFVGATAAPMDAAVAVDAAASPDSAAPCPRRPP